MAGLSPMALDDLRRRLRDCLGLDTIQTAEVLAGGNNRLFRLTADDGTRLLAKFYLRDERRRLEREFQTLSFLRGQGFTSVPRAILRSDESSCAVYSFEDGVTKPASDLTVPDAIALARFAADLHRFSPDPGGTDFPCAVGSRFSPQDTVDAIHARLRAFEEFAHSPSAYVKVRDLCATLDVRAAIGQLVVAAISDLAVEELTDVLPRHHWRLNSSDLAPHNVLFRPDGGFCVVDFEYAGWDDPARLIAGIVCHDASDGLSPEAAEAFLGAYRDLVGLPTDEVDRFARVRVLFEVEWAAIHLTAMTPAKVASRRFASADFDLHAYLANQVAKLKRRLARAQDQVSDLSL